MLIRNNARSFKVLRVKDGQQGFSVIIILLILLVVTALAGVGYYVLASEQKTDDAQNTARYHFQAEANVNDIASELETFYFTNKYYPSDLDPSTLSDLDIRLDQNVSAAPTNTRYVYKPLPESCSTDAKTCASFTLSAVDVVTNSDIITVRANQGN